jgi:SH3 domain protein
VRTADGITGWARSQHLLNEPTAALKVEALEAHNTQLQQELDTLSQNIARARELESENQRLHENYQLLQTRADFLQAENDQLKRSDRYNQWVYGGGLLLGGVLLSFFLQGLGRRRRHTDWR